MQSFVYVHFKEKRKIRTLKSPEATYITMGCGQVWMPFIYKVIRNSSVLAALRHLQMMRNNALKHPQPALCLCVFVCALGHTGSLK